MLRVVPFVLLLVTMLSATEHPVIPLWPEGIPGAKPHAKPFVVDATGRVSEVHEPRLTVWPAAPGKANGTAVVICPGGGYAILSEQREGVRYAEWLNELGVTCFIVRSRLKEYGHPAPLRDVLRAMRIVRSRAAEFAVDPHRIGIIGSSAGGHLASSASTLYDHADGKTGAALDTVSARPDFALLLYPVILMDGPHIHVGSRNNLIGEHAAPELVALMSADRQVNKETPPTFIIHAEDDHSVPVENALAYYTALRRAGVPVEMHLYEKGGHGFAMEATHPQTAQWPQRAETWLRSHGWVK
ncbi:MAG: alpha/beta hydrolase [Candidatus Didemnitutus sp.]|nr:alpha/beta hydrolase [Candidatus Didemnitutus sp.]